MRRVYRTAVWVICLQLGCAVAIAARSQGQQPVVKIRRGLLEGARFGSEPNAAAFLGIPYAAAPDRRVSLETAAAGPAMDWNP
jgi:hypothetical protein